MKNKFLVNKLLQNTQNPQGFLGKMMLFGMNCGHARLAEWGMSHLEWQANWVVLDIGCGGGANITEILRRCPDGIVYGLDTEEVSMMTSNTSKYPAVREKLLYLQRELAAANNVI